jgi:hypothetical protein
MLKVRLGLYTTFAKVLYQAKPACRCGRKQAFNSGLHLTDLPNSLGQLFMEMREQLHLQPSATGRMFGLILD